MEKLNVWKFAKAYIKYCRKFILLFTIAVGVFAFVFFLYDIPIKAVTYSTSLCIGIFLPLAVIDIYKFYKTHKLLTNLRNSIVVHLDNMPPAKDLIVEDYQKLIEIGFADKMKNQAKSEELRNDLISYYTMWVHQIKTPISAMWLILQTDDIAQSPQLLPELYAQLIKIDQYVDMVLNYIKIGNDGETDFVFQKYSLDTIVQEAVHKYAKLFIRKRLTLNYQSLSCTVLTDKKWLLFVIEQVLSNSLKYTKKGSISIYMDKDKPKSLVIEDTGIGIENEDLPRIFDRGYTGYNGRKDRKSTGIGLYLCKTILIKLSHDITVQSKVGIGTRVIIDLDTYEDK
ncbi:MAG TPA: HAMP domain-containing histidine kinase [Clostridiales bacterium]|nr:HAMP domain-containing histidine kinase [Clostridiales bacterium]